MTSHVSLRITVWVWATLWFALLIFTSANVAVADDHIVFGDHAKHYESVSLNDGWTVFRGQLIAPAQFQNRSCADPLFERSPTDPKRPTPSSERISLPDVWGPALTTTPKTGHGVATFCRDIDLPNSTRQFGIRFNDMRSIASVYALYKDRDGHNTIVVLMRNGNPNNAQSDTPADRGPRLGALPYGVQNVKVVIQLANYVHKQGGLHEPPILGAINNLEKAQRREASLAAALVLTLILMAAATLVLGFTEAAWRGSLIFAMLSLAGAFRVFFVSDIVWDYFPALYESRKYDLEYCSMFTLICSYYAFISFLFRKSKFNNWDFCVYGVAAAFCFFSIFMAPHFQPGTITLLRELAQLYAATLFLSVLIILYRNIFKPGPMQITTIIVAIAAGSILIYEVLASLGSITLSMEWSQLFTVAVTLVHLHAFAKKHRADAHDRFQLSQSLKSANSDLQEQTGLLKQAAQASEQASRAKSEFLAAMSHELRTPLNAIIGLSEMMTRGIFGPLGNDRYREYAEDIRNSGNHLLALVNDILDLSRIESGTDDLNEDYLDLEETARTVLGLAAPQAAKAGVTCTLSADPNLAEVYADQRKIKQILINLVSNAIKFNKPSGTVHIDLAPAGEAIDITVSDTGIGIKPEDIEKAMTKFAQVDSNLNRRYEGIGLGLPIVKGLVELHGGAMKIDSTFGEGTQIVVSLPKERCVVEPLEDDDTASGEGAAEDAHSA